MSVIDGHIYYNHLLRILDSESNNRDKILDIFSSLSDLFLDISNNHNQFFLNFYAASVFIGDKYLNDIHLTGLIHRFRFFTNQVKKNDKLYPGNEDIQLAVYVFVRSVEILTKEAVPDSLNYKIAKDLKFSRDSDYKQQLKKSSKIISGNILKGKVVTEEDYNYSIFILDTEEFGEIIVKVYGKFYHIAKLLWKGCKVNLIDFTYVENKNPFLKSSSESYVIIDPDYLVDVTDIAECFNMNGYNEKLYFLKKFIVGKSSQAMIIGNLVNSIFDELLTDNSQDFDSIIDRSINAIPIQVMTILKQDPESYKHIRRRLAEHYTTLKSIIRNFDSELLSIEPSFVSAEYGIQGRLDAMIEFENEVLRKDIVELKSGKSPSHKMFFKTISNQSIQTGVWPNNLAQISLYNLLLDAAYPNRKGTSMVLYSQTDLHPIRNVPNIVYNKQDAVLLRNHIVAIDKALSKGDFSLFNKINNDDFGDRPTFVNKEISEFAYFYTRLNSDEQEYFFTFINFIQKEIYAQKTGLGTYGQGFSALWNSSEYEINRSYNIIKDLKYDKENSELDKQHLVFQKPSKKTTTLRKGDLALLVPDHAIFDKFSSIVLKGYIIEIDESKIRISLRNKLIDKRILNNTANWTISSDHTDVLNRRQFKSVIEFISSNTKFKDLILAKRKPEFDKIDYQPVRELNSNQNKVIKDALSAKDYYLIKGPPGTGKTSYVLRNLVEKLLSDTNENILVLAYTNRAVDEICTALKKNCKNTLLRLGSKVSTVHDDIHIAALADRNNIFELNDIIENSRIIVSTVASILTNPEIFELKSFSTAIVDEASQILEPQIIGTLSKVERFILIGDERQLPAVISHTRLVELDTNIDPYQSLFERLLTLCETENWYEAYGLLTHQARMHSDLMKFPNKMFYQNELKTFPNMDWQYEVDTLFRIDSESILEKELAKSRILFIDTPTQNTLKYNLSEVDAVRKCIDVLIQRYGDDFNDNSIGVISPFRAQCAEIISNMDDLKKEHITVDTVERFQGSERDTIIFSLGVNREHDLNLIGANLNKTEVDRKFNVAITRATNRLIVIGNSKILSHAPSYSSFIDFIRVNGNIINTELQI